MRKRHVLVVTSSRADYGLLRPTLRALRADTQLKSEILVTGTHLSKRHGNTVDEIISDGFTIDHRVDLGLNSLNDSAYDATNIFSAASIGVAEVLAQTQQDVVLVLGDRYETLGICAAALLAGTPVAHVHGGEITSGSFDDSIRHAISKIANLHFPVHEIYAARLRQLGEDSNSIFLIDPPVAETINGFIPQDRGQLELRLGIDLRNPVVAVTYQPVTTNFEKSKHELNEVLSALSQFPELTYVVSGVNVDPFFLEHDELLRSFVALDPLRRVMIASLGHTAYLSLLTLASCVVGNSSSGVIEAPLLGTPSVNVGSRQSGRIYGSSVCNVTGNCDEIVAALQFAIHTKHLTVAPLSQRPASRVITETLKTEDLTRRKIFVDV